MGLLGFSPDFGESAGISPQRGGGWHKASVSDTERGGDGISSFWVGGWVAEFGRPPTLFIG